MHKRETRLLVTLLLLIAILLIRHYSSSLNAPNQAIHPTNGSTQSSTTASAPLGERTKTSACVANAALADAACTPGAIIPTATKEQICVNGYSKSVRNVTSQEKDQVFQEYGIATHTAGQYEIDHLVSLELGGSNDIANLWPEAADPTPGFHQKDATENYLHSQVCSGAISLSQAQQEVATNWLAVYQTIH